VSSRPLRLFAASAGLAVLLACALAAAGAAKPNGSPFYTVPVTAGPECHNVKNCTSVVGPWVVVPPVGEATWLLTCPQKQGLFGGTVAGARHGFVGGTNSRASSQSVQVWFDGQIGSPITQSITTGGDLYFHGITTNAKPGTYEPAIGCIRLTQRATGRSTVSARKATVQPGTVTGNPLDYHARIIVLNPGLQQSGSISCPKGERLVHAWKTLAFGSVNPPGLRHVKLVTARLSTSGARASVVITTAASLPNDPLAEVQIGVACTT